MAQSKASLNSIYAEIKTLRREVEKVSDKEMAEFLDIDAKMRRGERTRLDDALADENHIFDKLPESK